MKVEMGRQTEKWTMFFQEFPAFFRKSPFPSLTPTLSILIFEGPLPNGIVHYKTPLIWREPHHSLQEWVLTKQETIMVWSKMGRIFGCIPGCWKSWKRCILGAEQLVDPDLPSSVFGACATLCFPTKRSSFFPTIGASNWWAPNIHIT